LHSAIYDPEQDRMVIYGGESTGTRFGDAWSLDLDEQVWSQLTPTGAPPSARYGHSSVHEPASGRMVVFGGFDGTARNDCFALSLRGQPAWRQLLPRFAPSPRVSHNAVVNADRSRMIIFGGSDYGNDSWALDWTTVTVLDEEPVIQSPRAEFLVPEPLVVDRLALTVLHDRAVSETAIRFALERASRVDLDVIDVSGRRVRTLLQKMLGSGEHEIRWNGRDDRGVLASAGVYLVRLEAEGKIASRKIVLF
jgi:hypothetical protein